MNTIELNRLKKLAQLVRENVLEQAEYGGCFVGSAYSCVELIVYLYEKFMTFDFRNPKDNHRDFFFLSKGHAVSALYGYFSEKGLLEKTRLRNNQSVKDKIYLHPNPSIEGIEFYSGSLGHLLSVSVGVALSLKFKNAPNRVIVILGDGELNEGSNWEAIMIASAHSLDNLFIVIDRNKFQANFRTEQLLPLEPLADKFISFGCKTFKVNGHSFNELEECFSNIPLSGKPNIIIAETVRGRGIKSFENNWEKWFIEISSTEKKDLIDKIEIVSE